MSQKVRPYKPKNPVRVVTAASLFDGHDAAINIIRRILQGTGVEVIHLGHNRAVAEIVDAAIQEDAHAVGVSCYQGGHVEFFKYMVDLLREHGCGHIKVFGGGGGVIVPEEVAELEDYGVAKIYSPEDGRRLGLQGIINHFVESIDYPLGEDQGPELLDSLSPKDPFTVARAITLVERGRPGPGRGHQGLARGAGGKAEKIRRPGPGHHRHRRLGQVEPHRRGPAALFAGFPGQDGGRAQRGPHPAQERRRAFGRPHPHEQPLEQPHLSALPGHPGQRHGGEPGAGRRDHGGQGGRL